MGGGGVRVWWKNNRESRGVRVTNEGEADSVG